MPGIINAGLTLHHGRTNRASLLASIQRLNKTPHSSLLITRSAHDFAPARHNQINLLLLSLTRKIPNYIANNPPHTPCRDLIG